MEMTTNESKHIITKEKVQISQLFLSYVTLLSTIDVTSVVFNISTSHTNTNLTSRRFLYE